MKKHFLIWAAPLAALGLLIFAPALRAAELPDSDQVNKLLADARTTAFQLKLDADIMESFTRSTASWETHAVQITYIKEHVNDLFKQEAQLKEVRALASPWQRIAIDRIMPYLDELEGYTTAVIERINASPRNLNTPEYKDFLSANVDYSGDLAAMISDFITYGKHKGRMEFLNDKLELPVPKS